VYLYDDIISSLSKFGPLFTSWVIWKEVSYVNKQVVAKNYSSSTTLITNRYVQYVKEAFILAACILASMA
jgi:hypothetical protein